MGKNRLDGLFRDPTLERPTTDFFRVRLESYRSFCVNRETAARVIAAMVDPGPKLVRIETVTGSVAWIRADTVILVEESTRAQREAERRLRKELDDEEDDDVEKKW